jgi:Penicillin amidase
VASDGPATPETVPYPGVTIIRDRFDVPHVTATTHDGGVWAAGWIAAEDRGLLLEQARYNARVAAIDAPGLSAIALVSGLKAFKPSRQTEAVVSRQPQVLLHAGREGRDVLHDIDTFVSGINAYRKQNGPAGIPPWTRNGVYALNALKDQFLGEGGGDEAARSQFLGGLERRLGVSKGFTGYPQAAGDAPAAAVRQQLLRCGQPAPLPEVGLGRDRRGRPAFDQSAEDH